MSDIPKISFSAWSGTGKTTIIEKLISCMKARGFRVAVIKHDAHDFEIDREGKDSWRFTHAGADMTIISSKNKTALIELGSLELKNVISMVHDVDLIILEGYNSEPDIPRIGICRRETGRGFRCPAGESLALVTDLSEDEILSVDPSYRSDIPVFAMDAIEDITDFLVDYFKFTRC